MKALILTINDNILNGLEKNYCSQFFAKSLFSKGISLVGNNTISSNEESITETLNKLDESINALIILGEFDPKKNLQVKQLLCNYLQDELVENIEAKNTINNYYKTFNLPAEKTSEYEAQMPSNAKIIKNNSSIHQGFSTYAKGKHIIFLPNNLIALKNVWNNWFNDYIKAKFPKISLTKTLKTFGLKKPEALELLSDLLNNKNKIKVLIYPNDLELTIVIKYSGLTPEVDINSFTNNMAERLRHFIYAQNNVSLYEIAYTLLKFNNIKLSIAESITGGNISSNLIKNNLGISQFLIESIVAYSNESKINRLNIDSKIIEKYTAVSVETVYEMAVGLLENDSSSANNNNYVVATTGYASGTEAGLVYIAVGNASAVHVYKNNFTGSREKVIEMATKAALFYLIKKLKKNN